MLSWLHLYISLFKHTGISVCSNPKIHVTVINVVVWLDFMMYPAVLTSVPKQCKFYYMGNWISLYHQVLLNLYSLLSTGTRQFIRENSKFLDDCSEVNPSACNKDTGGCKTLHSWSRGVFFVVSAGGHIEYWQPLYRLNCVLEIYCEFKLGAHLLLLENYLDLVLYTSPLILKSHWKLPCRVLNECFLDKLNLKIM